MIPGFSGENPAEICVRVCASLPQHFRRFSRTLKKPGERAFKNLGGVLCSSCSSPA